jgi:uncharacterized protein (DUF433 family)
LDATGVTPTSLLRAASTTQDSCVVAGCNGHVCWIGGIVKRVSRLERITSDPAVCHGQPTIRGLRYTVESVLELLSAGMTIDEVLADYPDLERDDILAALEFGARAAGGRVVPLSAA